MSANDVLAGCLEPKVIVSCEKRSSFMYKPKSSQHKPLKVYGVFL